MGVVVGTGVIEPSEVEGARALGAVAPLPALVALAAVGRVVVAHAVAAALDSAWARRDGSEQMAAVASSPDLAVLVAAAVPLIANAVACSSGAPDRSGGPAGTRSKHARWHGPISVPLIWSHMPRLEQ